MGLIESMLLLVPLGSLIVNLGLVTLKLDDRIQLPWWKVIAGVAAITGVGVSSCWVAGTVIQSM